MLNAHLAALRAIPRFAGCRFRLIIECNLGQGSAICDSALTNLGDADVVCSTSHSYGVYTVPGLKNAYFARIRKLLAREAISFYETVVSACPYQAAMSRQELVRSNLEKMENQFRGFRAIYSIPKTVTARITVTMSGHGDQNNQYTTRATDDLVMATAFGIYFAVQTIVDPPFTMLRTRLNRLY